MRKRARKEYVPVHHLETVQMLLGIFCIKYVFIHNKSSSSGLSFVAPETRKASACGEVGYGVVQARYKGTHNRICRIAPYWPNNSEELKSQSPQGKGVANPQKPCWSFFSHKRIKDVPYSSSEVIFKGRFLINKIRLTSGAKRLCSGKRRS